MSELIYKPKNCAFHPKELIFNFCKNSECLLPLCPSCIRIHSEEHQLEKTYGQFQNIHKVVGDVDGFFSQTVKELNNSCLDMRQHQQLRIKQQEDLKKRIQEAKAKMITLVERFFSDFEKEVGKSIVCYNDSMRENYGKVEDHINELKKEIEEKSLSLGSDKVLKTLIGFNAKGEEQKYLDQVECIRGRIEYLSSQRVEVVCNSPATQRVIDELGNYIHLSFQNWQNEIKYVSEFVKTGFKSNSDGFNSVRT